MTKSLTLAALAAAATLGTASVASAENYIAFEGTQDRDFQIELRLVRAEMGSYVDIVEESSGTVLGTEMVMAGANADVFIDLDARPTGNVVAVLRSGDTVLDTRDIRIERN